MKPYKRVNVIRLDQIKIGIKNNRLILRKLFELFKQNLVRDRNTWQTRSCQGQKYLSNEILSGTEILVKRNLVRDRNTFQTKSCQGQKYLSNKILSGTEILVKQNLVRDRNTCRIRLVGMANRARTYS